MPAVDDSENVKAEKYERWLSLKDLILESEKGAVSLGNMALRSAMILNGAAAIALLAFIANQWTPEAGVPASLEGVVEALKGLVIGVFSVVLATGFGYLRMFFGGFSLGKEVEKEGSGKCTARLAMGSLYVAIILVIYSYVRFGMAMMDVSNVFAG